MTDTVSDIVVVGQRRKNDSMDPFPSAPNYDPPLPGQDATIDPIDSFHPCDDPGLRYDWQADAAAAKGGSKLEEKRREVGDPDFNTREYGAYLYRLPNGEIEVGPVGVGDPFQNGGNGSVDLPMVGFTHAQIIGSIHSHSVGNHLPSPTGPDGQGDVAHLNWISGLGIGSQARLYIYAQKLVNAGETPYNRINVYTPATAQAARDAFKVGPEVNRNGASCPI